TATLSASRAPQEANALSRSSSAPNPTISDPRAAVTTRRVAVVLTISRIWVVVIAPASAMRRADSGNTRIGSAEQRRTGKAPPSTGGTVTGITRGAGRAART